MEKRPFPITSPVKRPPHSVGFYLTGFFYVCIFPLKQGAAGRISMHCFARMCWSIISRISFTTHTKKCIHIYNSLFALCAILPSLTIYVVRQKQNIGWLAISAKVPRSVHCSAGNLAFPRYPLVPSWYCVECAFIFICVKMGLKLYLKMWRIIGVFVMVTKTIYVGHCKLFWVMFCIHFNVEKCTIKVSFKILYVCWNAQFKAIIL